MATTEVDLTGNKQQTAVEQLLCPEELPDALHGQLTFLAVVNSFLSVTAFLGNALVLIALHKETSLHPPSKVLLRSLGATDLCVGLLAEPLNVAFWMSLMNERWNICPLLSVASLVTSSILCGMSLTIMTAISVDRLLALLLGLRYRQVVTLKRTYVIVITSWVLSAFFSATGLWNPLIILWGAIIYLTLCLVISIFSYTKIFLNLRQLQHQVQNHLQQPNQTNQLNTTRYKKAVSSAIWLQLTLVACYLPHFVVVALWTNSRLSPTVHNARIYTVTLVYLNSSLNPILYCWKLEEVRQAVKDTIRQVLCHCFSS